MVAILFSAISSSTLADTLAGIYLGGGVWDSEFTGDIGTDGIDVEDELGLEDENQNYFFIALEHPIFFLPNFRLYFSEFETEGDGIISVDALFDDIIFSADEAVVTQLDAEHTDATIYYEILTTIYPLISALRLEIMKEQHRFLVTIAAKMKSISMNGFL